MTLKKKVDNTSSSSADGVAFQKKIDGSENQEYINYLLLWSCLDECNYQCMWRTTNGFLERKWNVPQFYGKWPFKRMFGIQEPASVLFSLLNFWAHFYKLRQFRKLVRNDSPMYYVWHIFCGVSSFARYSFVFAFTHMLCFFL